MAEFSPVYLKISSFGTNITSTEKHPNLKPLLHTQNLTFISEKTRLQDLHEFQVRDILLSRIHEHLTKYSRIIFILVILSGTFIFITIMYRALLPGPQ